MRDSARMNRSASSSLPVPAIPATRTKIHRGGRGNTKQSSLPTIEARGWRSPFLPIVAIATLDRFQPQSLWEMSLQTTQHPAPQALAEPRFCTIRTNFNC